MTALARSIGTQETVLYLNSALDVGSLPAPYLIDSEAVLVTGGDLQTLVYVSRGQFGTAPATHSLGTSLVAGWGGGGPGTTPTLAQVLAQGNDTGGVGIVSDATGSGTADASATATSVDGNAIATTTATASGTGTATANVTTTTPAGASGVYIDASSGSTHAQIFADGLGGDGVFIDLQSGGSIELNALNAENALTDDLFVGSGLGITATSTVGDTSAAPAVVKMLAINGTDQVSLSVVGANTASTPSQLQVNDLPLITTGSGAPGASFVSLIYVDTTAITGGGYCWDFVSGAYIKIGTV